MDKELLNKDLIKNFIKDNFSNNIGKQILFNQIIENKFIDIYLPNKKIAIMFRGYFWDNKDYLDPKKETIYFNKLGYRLISIYDYEWYNFPQSIKNFLTNLIKSRNKHLIRNYEVQEIDKEEFINFLKENHLFADTITGCTVMYGIYDYNKENNKILVAVSGFNKKTRKYNWEWKRFAIRYGWMSNKCLAGVFLEEFEKEHKGILCDFQQFDRYNYYEYPDEKLGFKRVSSNQGVVAINLDTLNFTRHDFIPEKPLNKQETLKKYGFDIHVKNSGTITWVKEII